jgi:hypothetical protein
MLAFFVSGFRGYAIAVVLLCLLCSALFLLVAIGMYKWTTREGHRYPAYAPKRIRPPRAEPVDFAKERYEYCASRDHYLEDRDLRRAV